MLDLGQMFLSESLIQGFVDPTNSLATLLATSLALSTFHNETQEVAAVGHLEDRLPLSGDVRISPPSHKSQLHNMHNAGLINQRRRIRKRPTTLVRGGAKVATPKKKPGRFQSAKKKVTSTTTSKPTSTTTLTPEARSVVWMAIAMAFHYLGYSIARSITVTLFTSAHTGFAAHTATAFPLAMTCVSPVALVLLVLYSRVLERRGPWGALLASTVGCAGYVTASAVGLAVCWDTTTAAAPASLLLKWISGPLFVFREAYVQLLTSQYWSFMASALTPHQAARWFGPIAGLTSLTSAFAGLIVAPLVRRLGLTTALAGTGVTLILSLIAASMAYGIARKHGFEPQGGHVEKTKKKHRGAAEEDKRGMLQKATGLFGRVPVLKALFVEILSSQGLATLLNVCFVARVGSSIPNDQERAGWLGKFYALVNVITMVLQFAVLPTLMTVIEPRDLWRVVPLVSLACTGFQAFQKDPSLYIVSASLLVMKVSEYSARRMLDEMIFVPLDFESRFLGKEVLGVFGYRFGKSLMSLGISAISCVDPNFGVAKQSVLSHVVCWTWLKTAWSLSNMVPTREEAEQAHKKLKGRKTRK